MPPRHGSTQEGLRRQNLGTLMRILHLDGAATRSQLAAATGLNRSTVGTLTADLAAWHVVCESRGIGGGVGRPSIRVDPLPDRVAVLAVDIRVGVVVVALVGFGGVVLARRDVVTATLRPDDPGRLVDLVARCCQDLLDEASGRCIGIGVGVPGLVHTAEDIVREAPNLRWTDVPLGGMLRARLGDTTPIAVRNDADLGALAEHSRGAGRGVAQLIYLAGEVGVGGGVIVDDHILTGAHGYGGEIGHMMVNPRGKQCRCGARGCWETEIGEGALVAASGHAGEGLEAGDVVRLAQGGDVRARRAIRQVATWLGIGVANLVNAFSPEVVVFGGPLREVLPMAAPTVTRAVEASLVGRRQPVRLAEAGLGGDSTLIGAAEVAFAPLFADPQAVLERR